MVKPSYALLIRAMFQSIERLASTDAKHGDRLRLESYSFFVSNVSQAAQAEPVLLTYVRQATAAKQRAMQAYVQQQLEHGKFWKLIEFSVVSGILRGNAQAGSCYAAALGLMCAAHKRSAKQGCMLLVM